MCWHSGVISRLFFSYLQNVLQIIALRSGPPVSLQAVHRGGMAKDLDSSHRLSCLRDSSRFRGRSTLVESCHARAAGGVEHRRL